MPQKACFILINQSFEIRETCFSLAAGIDIRVWNWEFLIMKDLVSFLEFSEEGLTLKLGGTAASVRSRCVTDDCKYE